MSNCKDCSENEEFGMGMCVECYDSMDDYEDDDCGIYE